MIVEIDGERSLDAMNDVKVILDKEHGLRGEQQHITLTHEGIVIDTVYNGEVVFTMSITYDELLEDH